MQVLGTGNVGKQDFDFGEKGNKRIYVRGKGAVTHFGESILGFRYYFA